jgi:hypothetical protein
MGHIRLGRLPRTRKWIQVFDLIGEGAGAPEVAASAMEGAQGGLIKAAKDPRLDMSNVPSQPRTIELGQRLARAVKYGNIQWR